MFLNSISIFNECDLKAPISERFKENQLFRRRMGRVSLTKSGLKIVRKLQVI